MENIRLASIVHDDIFRSVEDGQDIREERNESASHLSQQGEDVLASLEDRLHVGLSDDIAEGIDNSDNHGSNQAANANTTNQIHNPYFPDLQESISYNKCLFRTITLQDVKNELRKKKIEFSLTDSYLSLTLKLRLSILQEANAHETLIKPLLDHLKTLHQVKRVKKFSCCLTGCPFKTNNHFQYIKHLKSFHQNSKSKLVCNLKGCQRDFLGINQLEIHIKSAHRSRQSLVKLNQSQLVEQLQKLRCPCASCNHQVCQSIKELKKHLNIHLEKKENVACLFKDCEFNTDTAVTMRVHFSRKHRIQEIDNLKSEVVLGFGSDDENISAFEDGTIIADEVLDDGYDEYFEEDDDQDNTEDTDMNNDIETENNQFDVFMKAVAITYNDWMNLKNIPYSTCNSIIKEIFHSYSEGQVRSEKKIRSLLKSEGMSSDNIENILDKVSKDDPFVRARSELESESKRINFIKESFDYIQPETVLLDKQSGESYQYIPIVKSLKVLMEDETFLKQKVDDPYYPESGVCKDVRDGEFFKSNKFFQENPEAVPILMFQDELEIGETSMK